MVGPVKNMMELEIYFYICTTLNIALYNTYSLKSLGDTQEACYSKRSKVNKK